MGELPSPQDSWVEERVGETRRLLGAPPPPSAGLAPAFVGSPPQAARELAPFLDHTLLRADATPEQVLRLAEEARRHGMAGVCVNPWHVRRVTEAIRGSPVRTIAVVGFPLGATYPRIKADEATQAVAEGAREIDVVLNLGALKAGRLEEALADLRGVVAVARGLCVKVILETHLLSPEECVDGCVLAELAGAAFVKTSTGFSGGGARVEDVQLMRRATGDRLAVKASGGIRDAGQALALIAAGALRLGSSASVRLLEGVGIAEGY